MDTITYFILGIVIVISSSITYKILNFVDIDKTRKRENVIKTAEIIIAAVGLFAGANIVINPVLFANNDTTIIYNNTTIINPNPIESPINILSPGIPTITPLVTIPPDIIPYNGNCNNSDAVECSKYGIYGHKTYLTSRKEYIRDQDAPGVLIVFGSWKNESGENVLAPFKDIDIKIYEEGTHNIRIHKTIQTGGNGFALLEWKWMNQRKEWNKNWAINFSSGDFKGFTTFFSDVSDIENYTPESDILNEYPDTVFYEIK